MTEHNLATPKPAAASTPARAMLPSFDELIRSTEADYVTAGNSLAQAVERFETLEEAGGRIAGFTEGIDRVAAASVQLDASFRGAIDEVETAVAPLAELAATGDELNNCVTVMKNRVRTMRVLSINARVVIASISGETSGLMGFADDVRDAGTRIEAVLASVGDSLEHLRGSAAEVSANGERLHTLLGERAISMLSRLADDLETYKSGIQTLTSSGGLLVERGERLRRAVTAAVFALQAGDALRQRLEHCRVIAESMLDPSLRADSKAIGLLLRRQFEDLSARHRDEVGKAADALAAAQDETRAFLGEIGTLVPESDGPGSELHAAVGAIFALLEECAQAQEALHAGAQLMTERMREMLNAMADFTALGGRMRYIALNAVIACAGLGPEGDPLKAISHELRELADDCIEKQAQMQTLFQKLDGVWSAMNQRLDVASETMGGVVKASAQEIDASLAELATDLAAEGARIDKARSGLEEVVASGSDALRNNVAAVGKLAGTVVGGTEAPGGAVELTDAGRDVAARLRAVLSIEQERRVHDDWFRSVCGEAPPVPAPPAPAPANTLEDVFF